MPTAVIVIIVVICVAGVITLSQLSDVGGNHANDKTSHTMLANNTTLSTSEAIAIRVPGGYLKSICEQTGAPEVTKVLAHAEWYRNVHAARAVARFLVGKRSPALSGIYPFHFNIARACK